MRKYLLFACGCLLSVLSAWAAPIYNVPNYSSNPFYSPDGPYNQRPAVPVYVKGPSLTAAECLAAVSSAIWTQCSFLNNCVSATLADIRPGVIMELANRGDNNYSSCEGYIDGMFQEFKANVNGSIYRANFPDATKPSVYNGSSGTINPFAYVNQMPEYEREQKMRQYQLENLKKQNDTVPVLTAEKMPGTFQDLSLSEQMGIMKEGWKDPALNKYPTYPQIAVETDVEKSQRIRAIAEAKANAKIAAAEADARPALLKAQEEAMKLEAEARLLDAQRKLLEAQKAAEK